MDQVDKESKDVGCSYIIKEKVSTTHNLKVSGKVWDQVWKSLFFLGGGTISYLGLDSINPWSS